MIMTKPIVIVGSLNMDFVAQIEKLPMPGETVSGSAFQMLPGGKGANQAYAVGRLGGRGKMLGRVGEDVFGERLKASLESVGIDVSGVLTSPGEATGVALILVAAGGQNQIVVIPGANGTFSPRDLESCSEAIREGYLLMQLESPKETVELAAVIGIARNMVTILDPAPVRQLSPLLLKNVDVLTPNESEALVILGHPGSTISLAEAPQVAQTLLKLGPKRVILKLGEKGVWLADDRRSRHFPSRKVEPIDVTAAGDTFNGALAVALAEGKPLEEAISFANCAAAISVTRLGAQTSIPTRSEVEVLLAMSAMSI
jgi:ribokinase